MNYFETEKLDNWQIFADRYFKLFINLQIILILLLWKKRFPNVELAKFYSAMYKTPSFRTSSQFKKIWDRKKYEIENR